VDPRDWRGNPGPFLNLITGYLSSAIGFLIIGVSGDSEKLPANVNFAGLPKALVKERRVAGVKGHRCDDIFKA